MKNGWNLIALPKETRLEVTYNGERNQIFICNSTLELVSASCIKKCGHVCNRVAIPCCLCAQIENLCSICTQRITEEFQNLDS